MLELVITIDGRSPEKPVDCCIVDVERSAELALCLPGLGGIPDFRPEGLCQWEAYDSRQVISS